MTQLYLGKGGGKKNRNQLCRVFQERDTEMLDLQVYEMLENHTVVYMSHIYFNSTQTVNVRVYKVTRANTVIFYH